MKRAKARIYLFLTVFVLILFCAVSLFLISRSRNFQFFGEIHTSIPNRAKKIALTFDDGPTESTEVILNKLDELDIKATFFVCGIGISERPEDARAIVRAGNQLGNHSYSHERMVLKSYAFCKEEIEKTNALIRESGFDGEIFFRPPYGKKLFVLPYYLSQVDMTTIMWSIEPETTLGYDATPDRISQYVLENIKSGSIILLHPMYNAGNVLAALDIIVPELQQQGYVFCTVSDLYNEYKLETNEESAG